METYIESCKYCNKLLKNKTAVASHQRRCSKNPEKQIPSKLFLEAMASRKGKKYMKDFYETKCFVRKINNLNGPVSEPPSKR